MGLLNTNATAAETANDATRQMTIATMFHTPPEGSIYTGSEVIPGITKPKHLTPRIWVSAPPMPHPTMAPMSGVLLGT